MRPDARDAGFLWDILQHVRGVLRAVGDRTFEDYVADEDLRLAVERRIEIIGEAARQVSETFREAHPEVPWRKIVAQRNVLAHECGVVLPCCRSMAGRACESPFTTRVVGLAVALALVAGCGQRAAKRAPTPDAQAEPWVPEPTTVPLADSPHVAAPAAPTPDVPAASPQRTFPSVTSASGAPALAPVSDSPLTRVAVADMIRDPSAYTGQLLDVSALSPGTVPEEQKPASPFVRLLVAGIRTALRDRLDAEHPAITFTTLDGYTLAELRGDLARYEAGKERDASLYPSGVVGFLEDAANAAELQRRVIAARNEFVAMTRSRGVAARYLEAIDEVLPAAPERIVYYNHEQKPDPARQTGAFEVEGSSTRMVLSVHAANVKLPDFPQARILDGIADETLRYRIYSDMSLRMVVYHEMIHVTQTALVRAQLAPELRDEPFSHIDLARHHGLIEPEKCLYWGQGERLPSFILCVQYANERQAEGLMLDLLFDAYRFNERQRANFRQVRFGALRDADAALLEAVRAFDGAYPNTYLGTFAWNMVNALREEPELSEDDRELLGKVNRRYNNLEIGVAYSDPLWDWERFWAYLRQ